VINPEKNREGPNFQTHNKKMKNPRIQKEITFSKGEEMKKPRI